MTTADQVYVDARYVLLNTLSILTPHRSSLVVIGAQAIYLRCGEADLAVAPYTTDSDLAVDPALLATEPPIEALLQEAGYAAHAQEPGIWLAPRIEGRECIPVDLIVPEALSPAKTRRSAPLPGHAKDTLRKARGVEACIVDNDTLVVASLDTTDQRRLEAKVAGPAALLVAKAHKVGERAARGRTDRLNDKDALDIYRLMTTHPVQQIATTISEVLLEDQRSRAVTLEAIQYLSNCFAAPRSIGTAMAIRAAEGSAPANRIATVMNSFTRTLASTVGPTNE